MSSAPGAGSGIGNRSTSSRPGAFRTAARTVELMTLERYSFSVQLPAMGGVGGHQPAPARTRHHVEVVEVVAGAGGDRMVAARDQDDVSVAHLDRLVQQVVVGVDELHGEPFRPRHAVVVRLLEVGLSWRVVSVVLVGWIARPVACRGE